MISNAILNSTCSIKALTGQSYDVVGCPVSSTFSINVTGIPCYYTETTYETKDGKEAIRNVYLLYIPYNSNTSSIDTSYKVEANGKTFDVLNVEQTHNNMHIEAIIKEISI